MAWQMRREAVWKPGTRATDLRQDRTMILFVAILGASLVTLAIAVTAAIKFPTWSYRLIGLVSLLAFLFALHQFTTRDYSRGALFFSGLSAGLITLRVIVNYWRSRRR